MQTQLAFQVLSTQPKQHGLTKSAKTNNDPPNWQLRPGQLDVNKAHGLFNNSEGPFCIATVYILNRHNYNKIHANYRNDKLSDLQKPVHCTVIRESKFVHPPTTQVNITRSMWWPTPSSTSIIGSGHFLGRGFLANLQKSLNWIFTF